MSPKEFEDKAPRTKNVVKIYLTAPGSHTEKQRCKASFMQLGHVQRRPGQNERSRAIHASG